MAATLRIRSLLREVHRARARWRYSCRSHSKCQCNACAFEQHHRATVASSLRSRQMVHSRDDRPRRRRRAHSVVSRHAIRSWRNATARRLRSSVICRHFERGLTRLERYRWRIFSNARGYPGLVRESSRRCLVAPRHRRRLSTERTRRRLGNRRPRNSSHKHTPRKISPAVIPASPGFAVRSMLDIARHHSIRPN